MLLYLLLQTLRDGGQAYTETDLTQLIAEPWNGASATFFLLIVIYWALKLRGKYRQHLFMSICLPILLIGGIGGTVYHAFRWHQLFLVMDWLPIMILCLAASVYFLIKVFDTWASALLIMAAGLISQVLLFQTQILPIQLAINLNYTVMALLILVPTAMLLWKTQFHAARWVGMALGSFVIAITCRALDPMALLPMGTHFLWHVFGALACHAMFQYVYEINVQPALASTG
ncbi:MAG: hypothetical protein AAF804_05205 [Bacteroidota bacterium]